MRVLSSPYSKRLHGRRRRSQFRHIKLSRGACCHGYPEMLRKPRYLTHARQGKAFLLHHTRRTDIEHEYMLSSAALEERVGDSTVVGRHVHVVR